MFTRWKKKLFEMTIKSPNGECVFCDLSQIKTSGILYEDERVVAFRDRRPRAALHLLVIPKEHIVNTSALNCSHFELVEHMLTVGKRVLQEECVANQISSKNLVFGFHQYPFTSVDHLHLHCIAPPFMPFYNRLRYRATWFSNYISIETLLEQLKS
ncbi:hypothetical protein THRCLA_22277 [Thraustotheca clavata]|uniref:HIT domain-containing protein n=1 Tax=Thraustotheca clavata TaxID=74557 RepID=A0A1V9Z7B0_9STRA|nr:hypothetical protein THRCLA_22277 [Thraustotheca clavata]